MTTRIDVLVYWIIALCSAVASGQNFDRLLPPRETRSSRIETYRPMANAPRPELPARPAPGLLPNFDYRSLRDEIDRDYRAAVGELRRSATPAAQVPPAIYSDRDGRQADYRADMLSEARARVAKERARYEQLLRQQEARSANGYMDRNWGRVEAEYGTSEGGCSSGNCHHDPNVRPIGYGDWDDYGVRRSDYDRRGSGRSGPNFYRSNYRDAANYVGQSGDRGCSGRYDRGRYQADMDRHVARAAFENAYDGPRGGYGPNDYREARLAVDRDGNYVRENLYGEPRVFNPDQPVRNLFRYMFP